MRKRFAKKFAGVRAQLVASVFVAIAPALALTYIVNQYWFWQFAPDWMKEYALDVPWASFVVGLLALGAAWYGGEHFILRQVRALSNAAQRLAKGDLAARSGLKHVDSELGQLGRVFDHMAESLQLRAKACETAEKTLLNRALQQTAVAALGQFALSNSDLSALMDQAVTLVAQTLEVEYCAVFEGLPGAQLLLRSGMGWRNGYVGTAKVPVDEFSQAGLTFTSGDPILVGDLLTESRFKASTLLMDHSIVSGATILIPTREKPFGVFSVHTTSHREFTADDIQFLLAVANVIGNAVERLKLEEQLRQSQKMESVGQLAAGVAHDFNNMLAVIQGHATLLLTKGLPPEILDPIQSVYFAAERAGNLTRQLLMFSRKNVLQIQPLDLGEVVGNLSKMLRRLIGESITFEFAAPPDLPSVEADCGMIEQVVMNLCVNARDAMPHGGRLTISLQPIQVDDAYVEMHPDARAGNFLRLRVKDTGIGMDAATRARIFEPFFTTKEIGKGAGLGLATVFGIVKQHEGWIEVDSEPGQGATFDVFLRAQAPRHHISEAADKPCEAVAGGSETIFLVEDEPALRAMAREILQSYGYQIVEASSGREALAVWSEHAGKIDLLFTDMIMPEGISGANLAERLLAERAGLKIVFSSGYTANEINTEIMHKTRARFLSKPYTQDALAKIVREALDSTDDDDPAATAPALTLAAG
ncbi:MAG: ATP-binding protein [Verrucomicrobiota bacterium]|jgi:signal transduction histidine kinase/ActR/RegA family two-component response regulator/HAMP domain-containing protein